MLRVITYNLKITTNLKWWSIREKGANYVDSTHGDTTSYKTFLLSCGNLVIFFGQTISKQKI